jgi:hypothetical protein
MPIETDQQPLSRFTLTAGVGSSMLLDRSAIGVTLTGQAQGKCTCFGYLKWTPVIALGQAASIVVNKWINAGTFSIPVVAG